MGRVPPGTSGRRGSRVSAGRGSVRAAGTGFWRNSVLIGPFPPRRPRVVPNPRTGSLRRRHPLRPDTSDGVTLVTTGEQG